MLNCCGNQLTSLDVSKLVMLKEFDCSDNQLTSLDVGKNYSLTTLKCFENQLTSLDASKNNALINMICSENQLTSLLVNKKMRELDCSDNELTAAALDALFEMLNSKPTEKYIITGENPGADDCNRSIARDKGWKFENAAKSLEEILAAL